MFNGQRNKVIASLLLPSMLIAAGLFLVVQIAPACGCTVTSARSNIVGPFNNLTVYSTINTSLFPVGLTRKKIRLSFSEGDLRWTRVQILTVLVQRA